MGCGNCSSGGCGSLTIPAGCKSNGNCGVGGSGKLGVFDWLAGVSLPSGVKPYPFAEVRFKNTRKEFFKVENDKEFHVGDTVVVEADYGKDIGQITMIGELVRLQLKAKRITLLPRDTKQLVRKANEKDVDLWNEMKAKEHQAMLQTRNLVTELKINMKVSDVEFQADGTKGVFHYTAEDRVDYRELIKVLASTFKVRVEMKQIGARQEAALLGGIGSCGRELCCSTWLTDFRSVSTGAARYQQLAINPVKLAGQCGKLKCCLNFELDSYLDALQGFPKADTKLYTKKGIAYHQKTDVFKGIMYYAYADNLGTHIPIEKSRVNAIVELNKQKKNPEDLLEFAVKAIEVKGPDFENVVGQDDLTRFDKDKKKNNNRKKRKPKRFFTKNDKK